ncbi:MAG: hypothetical protein KDC69_09985 [Flavobacteriaceae bacterium]|nr:hypothetical protein [Flavobacteriaceae bacterium]
MFKTPYLYLGIVLLFSAMNISWQGDRTARRVLGSDAQGYYAYLPALFIYNDLSFGFADSISTKYFTSDTKYGYSADLEKGVVNKYFAGTALLEAPFFLLAYSANQLGFGPVDGYAPAFPNLISISGIFYLLFGLWFFERVCVKMGIQQKTAWLFGVFLVFGTNLFHYTVVEPGMSHVYSFALINGFIYQTLQWRDSNRLRNLLGMGFLFGLIFLVRPVNIIIAFSLPFFFVPPNRFQAFFIQLFKNWKGLLLAGVIALFVLSVQSLIYFFQTGDFWVYSYEGEGFNFGNPAFLDFLFSYKKGYFLYTPMAFLAVILGGYYLIKTDRPGFFYWSGFLIFLIYVLSSWWNWWYGGSFSSRVMIDFSIVLFFPFVKWLDKQRKGVFRTTILGVLFFLTMVCQIQTLQYRYFIIHWDSMNKELYWEHFLELPG